MFQQKKDTLLRDLKTLALRHNRDYYESIIPFVESADGTQEDLIDMYIAALDEDRGKLFASRRGLTTVEKVETVIL